ncbi:hypothetical protein ACYSNX_08465 [Myroides sp. LJL115]
MKLNDVKKSIDDFFDKITAEKLYEISVLKYGFSEISVDIENKHFETGKVSYYSNVSNSVFNTGNSKEDSNLTLAA